MTSLLLNVFTGTRNELSMNDPMPGDWPQNDIYDEDGALNNELQSHPGGDYDEIQQRSPIQSRQILEELFFDCPTSRPGTPPFRSEEVGLPSYLHFETDTSRDSESRKMDWRHSEPPRELLNCQAGSAREIKEILKSSIERLQARHNEEQRIQERAREEARVAVTSSASKLKLPTFEQLTISPLSRIPNPRADNGHARITSSFDSGYVSEAKPKRNGFGFSMFFKRAQKPADPVQPESGLGTSTSCSSGVETESLELECVSCLDDFPSLQMVKLVCHSYCKECFQRLISTALESETHWPAKCCLNVISSDTVLSHVDPLMKRTYKKREDEWSIPIGERMYCSQPSCSTFISPKYIKTQTNTAKCPTCHHKICAICRNTAHGMAECPQDPNIQMTNDLASVEGWKRCYQCQALVEHNAGCRHITCLCKAQFCYICTKRWKTCACTDADLTTIQQRAVNHRQEAAARTAREIAEAEEVRLAIQMVEEFERAEIARLELEAEVERRRQEELRQRLEEERVTAVSLLYSQLYIELESLHDIQKVQIAERHDLEAEDLAIDRQESLSPLSFRHTNEKQTLAMHSEMEISEMEASLNQEYQLRLMEERRIEYEYVDQLFAYWNGKPEAERRIRQARDELKTEQDEQYHTWHSHRREELEALIDREHEKMKTLRAKQTREMRLIENRVEAAELEWKNKKQAENQWVEEVVKERFTMLQEKEQEEYLRSA